MAKKSFSTQNNVSLLYPSGFGFGTGTINVAQQLGKGALTYGALIVGAEIIENDPRIFRRIDSEAKDDGCGDGREAKGIYSVKEGRKIAFKRSLLRAKIFGGGLVAFASMMRAAVWGEVTADSTILSDRKRAAEVLEHLSISYGGHTDNHANGENCGCGAIDKYPGITANALVFREEIERVLGLVLDSELDAYKDAIEEVFDVYTSQVHHQKQYFADASGAKTRSLLEENGAIIKELADDHLEDFVVINDVEGETFHQRRFDELLKARGITSTAQAFVVDLWRGRMYARVTAKMAAKQGLNKEDAFKKAFVDFLVRTLATAATLSKGDQPVFFRSARRKSRRLPSLERLKIRRRV